ncbi:MAG: hypothetical protein J7L19_03710 [Dehalococcoidia bacterium]|nr:hypothetical protein [Dehalococcoidia bacterium]
MTEPRREGISCKGEASEVPARDMSGQSVVATGFKQLRVSCNDFEYGKAGVGRLQLY